MVSLPIQTVSLIIHEIGVNTIVASVIREVQTNVALTAIESSHGTMLMGWRHHVVALLLLLVIVETNGLSFTIHPILTQEHCLDTIAFRRWSMRCDRRMRFAEQQSSNTSLGDVPAGDDAEQKMDELQIIRTGLDGKIPKDAGKYEAFGGTTVQFAAILGSDEAKKDDDFLTKIVGVIEAEPLLATKGRTFTLPNRLHIANLRTHQRYRRRGIGKALMEAVLQHAMSEDCQIGEDNVEAVTLKVEQDQNAAAASLYEQEGFVFDHKVYSGFMIKSLQ